jgi:hypothetical protein
MLSKKLKMMTATAKRWVTLRIQKDGRIFLGTAAHTNPYCSALRVRECFEVEGELAVRLPVCKLCQKHNRSQCSPLS